MGNNNSNLYGNINFALSKLNPNTTYQFRAVVKNNAGTASETIHSANNILDFTTNPSVGGVGGTSGLTGGGSGGTGGGGGGGSGGTGGNTGGGGTNCSPGSACGTGGVIPWDTTGTGTWTIAPGTGGVSGTWGSGNGAATWRATTGTGGTGAVTWYSNGIWTSTTGSGTWTRNTSTSGTNTGSTGTGNNLSLGQTATPPNDAIVRYHEGVETVFARQIVANQTLAQTYGYTQGSDLQTFAWYLADEFAKMFGYIDENGKEIRVSFPDVAAYRLLLTGNTLTVYEYYNNKIVDVRNINTAFKNASDYEYYYKK